MAKNQTIVRSDWIFEWQEEKGAALSDFGKRDKIQEDIMTQSSVENTRVFLYDYFVDFRQRKEKRSVRKMRKKWIASVLAAALLASLLAAPASAAVEQTVTPQEKTFTVKAKTQYDSSNSITATVTYTGYLGSIDIAADAKWPARSVPVLAEGSEIRFTINVPEAVANKASTLVSPIYNAKKASSALAPYGVALNGYETGTKHFSPNHYGGGFVYTYSPDLVYTPVYLGSKRSTDEKISLFDAHPISLFGQADGTSTWEVFDYDEGFKQPPMIDANGNAITNILTIDNYYYNPQGFMGTPWGKRTGDLQYTYKVQNGLIDYIYCVTNDVATKNAFGLGLCLSVNDAQLQELVDTGTMTFHKGTDLEYSYDFPGISKLFGLDASTYQSTAKLIAVRTADMDYDEFEVEVTNPTDTLDRGTVALVVASDMGTVHFIDYEVAPHSSRTYSVKATGHIGHMTKKLELLSGLEKYLNSTIITFESDEDMDAFKATIPHEAFGHHYDGTLAQNRDFGAITVCFAAPGDSWLTEVDIGRMATPNLYDGDNHDQCKG